MDANPFDVAAEFCKLVGVPSLLDYLQVSAQAPSTEAAEKLKARRKYMQGMQANPKYKGEAIFLIKNFGAMAEALADPRVYAEDVQRRSESGHLAVLELTMRGLMSSGRMKADQEQFLRNNARELRVSERSYERLLRRLAAESGTELPLPLPPPTPSMVPQSSPYPKVATLSQSPAPTPMAAPNRIDTAPPDRRDTAPPIRRTVGPSGAEGLPARLEVMGEPVRWVYPAEAVAIHIAVRNRGSGPMPGTVHVDVPWLIAVQSTLEADLPQQTIEVRVAAALVGKGGSEGKVEIRAGSAGTATIEVVLQRRKSLVLWWVALAAAGIAAVGIGIVSLGVVSATRSALVIDVDPEGVITLNGERIGSGTTVRVDNPKTGQAELHIDGGPNFTPWTQKVEVKPGEETRVKVELELARALAQALPSDGPVCDDAASRRSVGARLPGLKRCLAEQGDATTAVVVQVGAAGHAIGMELGPVALPNKTKRCIERQVGMLRLDPAPAAPCLIRFEIPRL